MTYEELKEKHGDVDFEKVAHFCNDLKKFFTNSNNYNSVMLPRLASLEDIFEALPTSIDELEQWK